MTHSATSRVLEDIIIEFRKKGLAVPENVLNDLKSARTLMKVENADDKGHSETSPKINEYFGSVEAYLVSEAQTKLPEQVDEWLRRLETASCDTCVTEEKEEASFISGVPRDQKWIRVTPLSTLPAEKLKTLAAETRLSVRAENDGHLIIYGHAEDIKEYLKKMTVQAGSTQR
jgi:hypothetical protein